MTKDIFSQKINMGLKPIANLKRAIAKSLLLKNSRQLLKSHDQLLILSHDIVSHYINLDGFYEKQELDFIFSWLKSLDTGIQEKIFRGYAIDAGANIGNHSIYFSKFFRKIVSFEPHPKIFQILKINSMLKKNVDVRNFGLSSTSASKDLFYSNENMGASSLDGSDFDGKKKTKVNLKKLDDIKDIGNVTFIKVDVEGHEFDVIKGSEKVIRKTKPIIMFEQFPSEFIGKSSKTIDLIKSFGYKNFAVIDNYPNKQIKNFKYLSILINIGITLIHGKKILLKIQDEFPEKYYQCILAIPEWVTKP